MTYFDLVSSHIEKNGGSPELIAAVRDYLEKRTPAPGASLEPGV